MKPKDYEDLKKGVAIFTILELLMLFILLTGGNRSGIILLIGLFTVEIFCVLDTVLNLKLFSKK